MARLTIEQEEQILSSAITFTGDFKMEDMLKKANIPFNKSIIIQTGYLLRKNGYTKRETSSYFLWRRDNYKLLLDLSPEANRAELLKILTEVDKDRRMLLLEVLLDTIKLGY